MSDLFNNTGPLKAQDIDGGRGRHFRTAKGYAAPPGTGPRGETCRSCSHVRRKALAGSKAVFKCRLNRAAWTRGRASDVLARSPACRFWLAIDETNEATP